MLFHAILANHSTFFNSSGSGETLEDGIEVAITETSSPTSGNDYNLGDTISWNVVVSNTGNALQGVVVQCTGMADRTINIAKLGTSVLQYSRTVTASEINAENGITITATATHSGLSLTDSDSFSATTVEPFVGITISLTEVNPLAQGELYEAGDVISWSFSISNIGSLDVSGASLSIICNGTEIDSVASYSINSGATDTRTGTYTITTLDAGSGSVEFSAVFQEAIVNNIEKPAIRTGIAITNINTDVDLSWRYIVNTALQASGNLKTGVPIRLYGKQSNMEVEVDWGDNSTTTLTPSSFTNSTSLDATHDYASAGTYTVTITAPASVWHSLYLMSCSTHNATSTNWNNKTLPIYWFRMTLKEILDPLPDIAGVSLFTALKPGSNVEGTDTLASFAYLFYSSNLVTIPDRLFAINSDAVSFQGTFWNSKLNAIPLNTFFNCNYATNYDHCFYGTAITTVASGVFNWADAVTDFSYLFYGCKSLKTMGAGLFSNSPLVTSFWSAWKNCSALTALPQNLFAYTPLASNFESSFASCTKIASIAADTFSSCEGATTFQQCFSGCTGITTVPQGLFDACTEVVNFRSLFYQCNKITSIPNDLFALNTKVQNFTYTLNGLSSLGDFDLDIGSTATSDASNFCTKKSGTTRNVNVPAGSSSVTAFNNVATACGITVTAV